MTAVGIVGASTRENRAEKKRPVLKSRRYSKKWAGCVERLGAVLHAGFGIFLKEIADVDGEALEFLVKGLS